MNYVLSFFLVKEKTKDFLMIRFIESTVYAN